ncbi:MAG: type II CRISPR RNA-guided endonuclease Cas9 [Verrucomicrobiota bacterium]
MKIVYDLSFDVGHSSIGWAVFADAKGTHQYELLGTGSVLFPADDCLARKRRAFRRQRRNIRATRHRIQKLGRYLTELGIISEEEMGGHGSSWPWLLAAQVLVGGKVLSGKELWYVLRWYAHNRGYDGNRRWSSGVEENNKEDTDKVKAAHQLMEKHQTQTMAETVCAFLGVDPKSDDPDQKKSSTQYFKGENVAFDRQIVISEVRRILEHHLGKIEKLTEQSVEVLAGEADDACHEMLRSQYKLPKRYRGSLLFGQLVPRFDNRIIASCPVTYERVYNEVWQATQDEQKAMHEALKQSKVPTKKCEEFLVFRWVMQMVNIMVQMAPDQPAQRLTAQQCQELHQLMLDKGKLSKRELKQAVRSMTGCVKDNLDAMFMHPDMDKALTLRPKDLPGGRASYTRKVMQKVAEEVLAGQHPSEEGGILYCCNELREAQLQKRIEQESNNHLVRHRMLILKRLFEDIVQAYAENDVLLVRKVTIEVNRDLQTSSGMTNKEKEQEIGLRLKSHKDAVKKLQKDLAGQNIPITASLIRKARIAEDLGWKCPFTDKTFDAVQLADPAQMEREHIIPRSLRPSDSLDSLVMTFAWVNKLKGQRTARQFIEDMKDDDRFLSPKKYEAFVNKLDAQKGHDDDRRRKRRRKELLLMKDYVEKQFTSRDLTITSNVVRLARKEIARHCSQVCIRLKLKKTEEKQGPHFVSLPGSVTGAVRNAWKATGTLAQANPDVLDAQGQVKTKTEIRSITHLHHALDACVLGLASRYIPNNGRIWELLIKRNLARHEQEELLQLEMFKRDASGRVRLQEISKAWKEQLARRLSERRVVYHIPAEMEGLPLEENTRGILKIEVPSQPHIQTQSQKKKTKSKMSCETLWSRESGEPLPKLQDIHPRAMAVLQQRKRDAKTLRYETNVTREKVSKIIGLAEGKLRELKGARVLTENYGVAVWQETPDAWHIKMLPWHKVWHQIEEIRQSNGKQKPLILRNGMIIKVPQGSRQGVWRIISVKETEAYGLALDLALPDGMKRVKGNAPIQKLLQDGMTVIEKTLIGEALNAD